MDIRPILLALLAREALSTAQVEAVFQHLLRGELTPAQIGGLLMALAAKGETVEEIAGAVRAMRANAVPLPISAPDIVDTCGTGGDASSTFNISTAAALIAAGAGVTVAKHGNRAMSGTVGAADVLEAVGVRIDLGPEAVARCIAEVGFGFLFAPSFHPAMKHAAGPRRELGVRTIFNLLGPLSSPAGARRQLIGVFSRRWAVPMAEVLQQLGSVHVLVVHGDDGLDELSLSAPTRVVELRGGEIRQYSIQPRDFGLAEATLPALQVNGREEAATALVQTLQGRPGPRLDIALLNAGAAVYVSGQVSRLEEGIERARVAVAEGAAAAKLEHLRRVSQG